MKAKLGWIVGLALAGSLGCSEKKSDAEAFIDSYCAQMSACCSQASLASDDKACRESWSFAALAGPYHPEAAKACLDFSRSSSFCKSLSQAAPSVCDTVYGGAGSGNRQPGETCKLDGDCAASSDGEVICAIENVQGTFVNQCQVLVPGKRNDTPCTGTQQGSDFLPYSDPNAIDVPSRGYVCNLDDNLQCRLGTCAALAKVGEQCHRSSDCVRDAFCLSSTCAARVASGGTCVGGDTAECVDGYYCDSSSKQCAAKVADGAKCSDSPMCQSGYCLNKICAENYSGLSSFCGS